MSVWSVLKIRVHFYDSRPIRANLIFDDTFPSERTPKIVMLDLVLEYHSGNVKNVYSCTAVLEYSSTRVLEYQVVE